MAVLAYAASDARTIHTYLGENYLSKYPHSQWQPLSTFPVATFKTCQAITNTILHHIKLLTKLDGVSVIEEFWGYIETNFCYLC